jgi:hypothetical protein
MLKFIEFINENVNEQNIIKKYSDGFYWICSGRSNYDISLIKDGITYITLLLRYDYRSNYVLDKITNGKNEKPTLNTENEKIVYEHLVDLLIDGRFEIDNSIIQLNKYNLDEDDFNFKDFKKEDLFKLIENGSELFFNSEYYIDMIRNKELPENMIIDSINGNFIEFNGNLTYELLDNGYSKEFIKSLISLYPNLNYFSEVVLYHLYKNEILSEEEFVKNFDDLIFVDGEIKLFINSFRDLESFFDKKYDKNQIIDTLDDGNFNSDLSVGDYIDKEYVFSNLYDLNSENLKKLIEDKIRNVKFTYSDGNSHIIDKYEMRNKYYYLIIGNDIEEMELSDFLKEYCDEFQTLVDDLVNLFRDVYRWSIENEYIDALHKSVKNLFGDYKQIKRGKKLNPKTNKYEPKYIYVFDDVDLKIFNVDELGNNTKDDPEFYNEQYHSSYLGFYYEEIFDREDRPDYIGFDEPYYGYSGDTDKVNDYFSDFF